MSQEDEASNASVPVEQEVPPEQTADLSAVEDNQEEQLADAAEEVEVIAPAPPLEEEVETLVTSPDAPSDALVVSPSSEPLPTTSSSPSPPSPPPPAPPPPIVHPPNRYPSTFRPPSILRPPQSSHASSSSSLSRFSFRRDVLQSLTAGAPAGAVAGGVQEAAGNALGVGMGVLGGAWGRLRAAAGAAQAQAQQGKEGEGQGGKVGAVVAAALNAASAAGEAPASSPSSLPSSSSSSEPPLPPPASNPPPPSPSPVPPAPQRPSHPLPLTDLKRVRFRPGPAFSIVYPINRGTLEPIAPAEEREMRESVEAAFRSIVRGGGGERGAGGGGGKGKAREKEGGKDGKDGRGKKVWTGRELERVYEEACKMAGDQGDEKVRRLLRENPTTPPKQLDLSNTFLSRSADEALSDLLALDWGCKKLVLDNCGLDDESLKPLLHALLVSGCIPTVSLAGNKRIKQKGWKLIAIFVRKASFLRYLDLSEMTLDRRAAEYLVQALNPPPAPSPAPLAPPLPTQAPAPPPKANGVAVIAAENGSAAGKDANEEGGKGKKEEKKKKVAGPWDEEEDSEEEEVEEDVKKDGVAAEEDKVEETKQDEAKPALRVEEKKEEEGLPSEEKKKEEGEEEPFVPEPLFDPAPLLRDSFPLSSSSKDAAPEYAAVTSLRLENCTLRGGALEVLANGIRTSQLKHISLRKNRINPQGAVQLAVLIRDYPISSSSTSSFSSTSFSAALDSPSLASSNGGGGGGLFDRNHHESTNSVTARQRPLPPPPPSSASSTTLVNGHHDDDYPSSSSSEDDGRSRPSNPAAQAEREAWRLSEARVRLRRQVEELPRVGALLTLDVKGNDLRNGVSYIAQVLKRNRTLKVLNLSENKIDVQGLVAIAEALKYNTSLETLDLSFNPCCSPSMDGILALRSCMMVSSSLKRIFLNSTALTSEGAIALAEFLPESRSLLHLDLTDNNIDISGVLALSVSLKLNYSLRCLDLNIPFDDPDFSSLSQSILESCVRNTEIAQQEATARAAGSSSSSSTTAAANAQQQQQKRIVIAAPIRKSALASNLEAQQQRTAVARRWAEEASRAQGDIFAAAKETRDVVAELLAVDQEASKKGVVVRPSELVRDALVQLSLAEAQLAEAHVETRGGEERERAEILLTELSSLLDLAKTLYEKPQPSLPPSSPVLPPASTSPASSVTLLDVPPPAPVDTQPSSPTFSISSSDDSDSDTSSSPTPKPSSPITPSSSFTPSSPSLSLDPSTVSPATDLPLTAGAAPPYSPTPLSPLEADSRAMVAEESEVFRKGLALGVDEVPSDSSDAEDAAQGGGEEGRDERDVSGEELRREILEAEVDEELVESARRRRGSRGSFGAGAAGRPEMGRRGSRDEIVVGREEEAIEA
ncbi:hypothetical protein JCM8547_001173 [Rhodosporidiobolus lusitaniae]